ncbi:MAG: hypothetical protein R3F61_25865 [Myxococcota bacterium]
MRRRFLALLLVMGTIAGFASGFASLHDSHPHSFAGDSHDGWHERHCDHQRPAPPPPER